MEIDKFIELVRKRRSIRAFKSEPIPDEYIEKILEAARWAMSGANGQPWEFIVVKDKETRNKITAIYAKGQKEKWYIEQSRIEELRHSGYPAGIRAETAGFRDAPVFIVVCGDPRTFQASALYANFLVGGGGFGAIYFKNMANATQNIHLAAAALGLGTEWVTINAAIEGHLKNLLDVPNELDVHTIVPIGYPAYEPSPPYRRELKEIVHFEKYDRSKYRSGEDILNFIRDLRQRMTAAYAKFWG